MLGFCCPLCCSPKGEVLKGEEKEQEAREPQEEKGLGLEDERSRLLAEWLPRDGLDGEEQQWLVLQGEL